MVNIKKVNLLTAYKLYNQRKVNVISLFLEAQFSLKFVLNQ
jgi:hypothetical protein